MKSGTPIAVARSGKVPAPQAGTPDHSPPTLDQAPGWDGLSQAAGNQALRHMLSARLAQAKLEISQPRDPLEQEADQVARVVVSKPARKPEPSAPHWEGAVPVHTAQLPPGTPRPVRNELGSPGRPLDLGTRASMEGRFGRDFSAVRIHTGPEAEAAAASIQAKAFTIGGDVVFGRGSHPSGGGQELLAHELTHVAQQGHAAPVGPAAGPAISSLSGTAATPRAFRKTEFPDYGAIAKLIHDAIAGLGTDEEGVYSALRLLDRDPDKIKKLEARYLADHKETLLEAIEGDFSDTELEYALQLINRGKADSGQRIEKAPETPAEWEASARRLWNAMKDLGTDEEAIYAILQPLNRDETQIAQLKEAYKKFDSMDLVERIRDEMSGSELNHALFLLHLPTSGAEEVTQEAEKVHGAGTKMTWTQSSPGSGNTFESWASAASETAAPPVAPTTTINCWEMILLMAYRRGTISWKWVHELYIHREGDWGEYLVQRLSSGPRLPYKSSDPKLVPSRGDIVFFDGPAHVALANGVRDGAGNTEVLSFWPPPDIPYVEPISKGTPDRVKVVTIEALETHMSKGGAVIDVTFAAPPW